MPPLGGMAATRASGTNAVRYGTMRENVLGLTVVTADGRIIKTGRRARKSAAGYDLTRLFIGSEGTLGVITEVTLRLYGVPEAISAAVCSFPDNRGRRRYGGPVDPDRHPRSPASSCSTRCRWCREPLAKLDYPEQPTLFFEFHGTEAGVAEQAEMSTRSPRHMAAAISAGRPSRRSAPPVEGPARCLLCAQAMRPGASGWATDVCVPICRLAECISETKADLRTSRFWRRLSAMSATAISMSSSWSIRTRPELAEAKQLNERMVMRALAMGGTCTGEHGIGYGKHGLPHRPNLATP